MLVSDNTTCLNIMYAIRRVIYKLLHILLVLGRDWKFMKSISNCSYLKFGLKSPPKCFSSIQIVLF